MSRDFAFSDSILRGSAQWPRVLARAGLPAGGASLGGEPRWNRAQSLGGGASGLYSYAHIEAARAWFLPLVEWPYRILDAPQWAFSAWPDDWS